MAKEATKSIHPFPDLTEGMNRLIVQVIKASIIFTF